MNFKHFIALNALDALLTWYALTYQGLNEANPFVSVMFLYFGVFGALLVIKILGVMLMFVLIRQIPENRKFIGIGARTIGTNIICAMFVLVVINNIYQIVIV